MISQRFWYFFKWFKTRLKKIVDFRYHRSIDFVVCLTFFDSNRYWKWFTDCSLYVTIKLQQNNKDIFTKIVQYFSFTKESNKIIYASSRNDKLIATILLLKMKTWNINDRLLHIYKKHEEAITSIRLIILEISRMSLQMFVVSEWSLW